MECKVTYLPFILIAIHTNIDGILVKESKSIVSGNNFHMHLNYTKTKNFISTAMTVIHDSFIHEFI